MKLDDDLADRRVEHLLDSSVRGVNGQLRWWGSAGPLLRTLLLKI